MNEESVEYLLIGGYAVGFYGYPRTTGDMDIWIACNESNAERIRVALTRFGMAAADVERGQFTRPERIIRMGVPPLRLEIHTAISGCEFPPCFARRETMMVDGCPVNLISREDLIVNKRASGRNKDLADIDYLKEKE